MKLHEWPRPVYVIPYMNVPKRRIRLWKKILLKRGAQYKKRELNKWRDKK